MLQTTELMIMISITLLLAVTFVSPIRFIRKEVFSRDTDGTNQGSNSHNNNNSGSGNVHTFNSDEDGLFTVGNL